MASGPPARAGAYCAARRPAWRASLALSRLAGGSARGRGRPGRPWAAAAPDGGPDAADRDGLPGQLLRRDAGRRHSRAHLSAGPHDAAGRPSHAPRPHPGERASHLHHHRRASQAAGADTAGARVQSASHPAAGGTAAGGCADRIPAPGQRHRLPAIHIWQHGRSQGRHAEPRQPAGQHPRPGPSLPGHAAGRVRIVAAPVSRHGFDRCLARHLVPRHSAGADVATGFPGPARLMAADDLASPGHHLGGAQLCLRIVPAPCGRCRVAGARPVFMAARAQRRGTGQCCHRRRLHAPFCRGRTGAANHDTGLWPGRIVGRPGLSAARPGAAHGGGRARGICPRRPMCAGNGAGWRRVHIGIEWQGLAGPPDPHRR